MWHDNETNRDFLNFKAIANTVAELVVQALSIGVSGGWGAGKSSMIHLISDALNEKPENKFLFVSFNAWLYQGYDDARAALMDVIAQALVKKSKTGIEKAKDLISSVNWLRVASLTTGAAISMSLGLPPTGLIGEAYSAVKNLTDGDIKKEDISAATDVGKKIIKENKGIIKDKSNYGSPPKEIQNLRDHFSETLKEMDITLVVLIDDLDRCLPQTAIATLEAIRLFLFLDHTAFIIAADEDMIRHAVRTHFKDITLDDKLVTNYFDKLIQIPIKVPLLGTQDVRAYLMLLFVETSEIAEKEQDGIRKKVCSQLALSWQGKRVDREFMNTLIPNGNSGLKARFDLADRLAPAMPAISSIAFILKNLNPILTQLCISLCTKGFCELISDFQVYRKSLFRGVFLQTFLSVCAKFSTGCTDGTPEQFSVINKI